jgi:hypothetical protein
VELSYFDRDSHRANPRRDRETPRGDQSEDGGHPRTSGAEDEEMTDDILTLLEPHKNQTNNIHHRLALLKEFLRHESMTSRDLALTFGHFAAQVADASDLISRQEKLMFYASEEIKRLREQIDAKKRRSK